MRLRADFIAQVVVGCRPVTCLSILFSSRPIVDAERSAVVKKCRLFVLLFLAVNWNEGGILLVVAVLPIHPFIPLVKIKLARTPGIYTMTGLSGCRPHSSRLLRRLAQTARLRGPGAPYCATVAALRLLRLSLVTPAPREAD